MMAANVPSGVKVPTCSSYRINSHSGMPRQSPSSPVELRIYYLGGTVDILRLELGGRVRALKHPIETIPVQCSGFNILDHGLMIPACSPVHGNQALPGGEQVDLHRLGQRRPHAESAAPIPEIPCAHSRGQLLGRLSHLWGITHDPCPACLKNTADRGGRVRFKE